MGTLEPLRTDMDRNTGRGPPERNRQAKEAMAVQGAQEAHGVARGSGGHGSAGSSGWPWQVVLVAVASVPSARPLQPEPLLPPKNFPWGSEGVSGALRG